MPFERQEKDMYTCIACGKTRTLAKTPQVGSVLSCRCGNKEPFYPPAPKDPTFITDAPKNLISNQIATNESTKQAGSFFDPASIANNLWASLFWLILSAIVAWIVAVVTVNSTLKKQVKDSLDEFKKELVSELQSNNPSP